MLAKDLTKIFLAAALLAGSSGVAHAVDTLLGGKRLVINNRLPDDEKRNRLYVSARNPTLPISPPGSAGDPTCTGAGGGGGRLTVTSLATGESHVTQLPCENWTGRKTGSWRYNDRFLTIGTCKRVEIRSTRALKAICDGKGPSVLDFDLVPGVSQNPIQVVLELGTGPDRYCMQFGGTVKNTGSDGKKFFARDSGAPAACP
jgi:hypothetical protein